MTDYSRSVIDIEDATAPRHGGLSWNSADRLPGRFARVSIVGQSLTSETGVRAAVAKLQEWLGGEPLRPLEEWHDDHGAVLWWDVDDQGAPLQETPWHIGCPLDTDWPDVADGCRFWAPLPRVRGPRDSG